MKSIEIDDDLYAFIASQTKHIGESASQILRRLLLPEDGAVSQGIAPIASSSTSAKTSESKSADVTEVVSQPATEVNTEAASKTAAKVPVSRTATKGTSASVKTATKKTQARAPAKSTANATNNAKTTKKASVDADTPPASEAHTKRDILDAVSKDALSTFTKRVDQFLFVLSAAHKLNAENFASVESIKGKNRTYFAKSKAALLENGSSTNPKAIPDSPFWVVTNNNTAKKTNMLEQVLRNLGYQPDVIETVVARFSSEGK